MMRSLALTTIAFTLFLVRQVRPQDLSVHSVTVSPNSGGAGDAVEVRATIKNNGPGWAVAPSFQWYMSKEDAIASDSLAIGEPDYIYDILQGGDEVIASRTLTIPPLNDPSGPSYIGLLLDPYNLGNDPDPSNNYAATEFTYTGGGSSTAANSFFDPTGDHPIADVTHVQASTKESNGDDSLDVTITFAATPPSMLIGLMSIDLDQDPTTGADNNAIPGAEAVVHILHVEYAGPPSVTLFTEMGEHTISNANLEENTLSYSIPLNLLENDRDMDLFWTFAGSWSYDFDRAPDVGAFATDTGEVVVRRPGNPSIHVDTTDGSVADDFPNMSGLQVDVIGDQLQMVLTYAHSVEALLQGFTANGGIYVIISVDQDKQLSTGFTNTEQRPPCLGADYEVRLLIEPLPAGGILTPELWHDENGDGLPTTTGIGLGAFNDVFVRLDGNDIICRIPLSYVGFSDGSGAISVLSLHTLEWNSDRLPDAGAWDLETNQIIPPQSCKAEVIQVDDADNDSLFGAGGYDNDELVGLDACFGDDALLLMIEYESYELSREAATLVYFDTDRNKATGDPVSHILNDATAIGAEYTLHTYWDADFMQQFTFIRDSGADETFLKNPFTTIAPDSSRLYITIPLESIGNPTGGIDVMLQTASWSGGSGVTALMPPSDDLPDQGVITMEQ